MKDIEAIKFPGKCNICGGRVVYCSNARIYGREYGSGKCYLCTKCGAYVGTHRPRPREALGLLSDPSMRVGKQMCHELFDAMWKTAKHKHKAREKLYTWLAEKMGIPVDECHFGYFDLDQLRQAYTILKSVEGQPLKYDNCGNIIN